jgi:hypothetical protein
MELAVINSERDRRALPDLDALQLEQFKHDEMYHREIARLNIQDRLKHMALHFAKYAGNVAEAGNDEGALKKAVTDTFIIAVSTANILNARLPDVLSSGKIEVSSSSFGNALAIHAGRMAAACEKLDHLEDVAFRPVIRENALALLSAAMGEAERRGWTIADLVRARLAGVKQKMIFHGRL